MLCSSGKKVVVCCTIINNLAVITGLSETMTEWISNLRDSLQWKSKPSLLKL